jgi:hypothetical protein
LNSDVLTQIYGEEDWTQKKKGTQNDDTEASFDSEKELMEGIV